VEEDKIMESLKQAGAKLRNELEIKREKQEIRRRLMELFVEKRTMSFEPRRQLFTNRGSKKQVVVFCIIAF
jgi:hypothetical protein